MSESKLGLKCLKCGDVIFSKHRHDFRRCKCGACFVDGGDDYFRYGFTGSKGIEVVSKDTESGVISKHIGKNISD